MLYYFLYPLHSEHIFFNVFRYQTFRTLGGLMTALLLCLVFGRAWIRWLKNKQIRQAIRNDGPKSHHAKSGTPTMGGVLVLVSMLIAILLWGDLKNSLVRLAVGVLLGMGVVGFFDDYRKVARRNAKGLSATFKITMQIFVALVCAGFLYGLGLLDTRLYFPFFKHAIFALGGWYYVFAVVVIVGTSNAVNLTDGLDGLVTMPAISCFLTYGLFAYLAGNLVIADYLHIPTVKGAGELAIVCGTAVGACLGFLWFNTYPAQIFMGDVGSLALGGLLGVVALMTKQEILLLLVGGIFVLETLSVMTQVISFKLTGKRVFAMAPLHHHFELKGWQEPKVIVRFWIISFILALLSLTSLKLR